MASHDLSPEVLWYLEDRGIAIPEEWQKPIVRTPEPREIEGARFNPARVDKVLRVFHSLRHTQGRLAGQPLDLDPWQVAYIIAPVFGWEIQNSYGDWVRIIRDVWIEVPRKNGKTTLAGGIAIYLTAGDDEPGAQVVAAATTREQAGYCFQPIASLAENSPQLKKYIKTYRSAHKVVHSQSGSYFTAISSIAEAIHGANIHGAVIDEVHLHKTPDLIEAIETGVGSRAQPLIVKITTADEGKPNTIYSRTRSRIEALSNGVLTNAAMYGVIWAGALSERELDDPFSVGSQMRSNPGYGVSPSSEFLNGAAKKAKESPAELASYLRLHLGVRTKQTTKFIPLADWQASAGDVDEEALKNQYCFAGIDLSSVHDISSLCLTFPDHDNDTYRTLWRMWIPEDQMKDLNRRTANEADVWVRDGFLRVTPGNVIDNSMIVAQIIADCKKFKVMTVGYDPWGSKDVVARLDDEAVMTVRVPQGYPSLNGPMKELLRLVKKRQYMHGNNPVMVWMMDNLSVSIDPAGNVKPDKSTSGDRIDGVSAAVIALSEAIQDENGSVVNSIW